MEELEFRSITEESVDFGVTKFRTWMEFQKERESGREKHEGLMRFAEAVGFSDDSRRALVDEMDDISRKGSSWLYMGVLIGCFISEHHYEPDLKELDQLRLLSKAA